MRKYKIGETVLFWRWDSYEVPLKKRNKIWLQGEIRDYCRCGEECCIWYRIFAISGREYPVHESEIKSIEVLEDGYVEI